MFERAIDERFIPMLKIKIQTGEIDVDTRQDTYWKVNPFSPFTVHSSVIKRTKLKQKG